MRLLRLLQRWMLGLWLSLFVILMIITAYSVSGNQPGKLVAFLFAQPVTQVHVEPALQQPAPPQPAEPVPTPPTSSAPPAPQADWIPIAKGKNHGSGSISHPVITGLDDGRIMVTFDYSGVLGEIVTHSPDKISALSVDMLGSWKTTIGINKRLPQGLVGSRLQIFRHNNYLRISCIRANTVKGQLAMEASSQGKQWRIIFSERKP